MIPHLKQLALWVTGTVVSSFAAYVCFDQGNVMGLVLGIFACAGVVACAPNIVFSFQACLEARDEETGGPT